MKRTFILLIIAILALTACEKKLSEADIKDALEENTGVRTFTVNSVAYATDTITINGIAMHINENEITLDDYTSKSNELTYRQITGYYDQPAATYNIYVLAEDKDGNRKVMKKQKTDIDNFEGPEFVDININNATDLILIDCHETIKDFGESPLRYQVYALIKNELVLLN